MWRYGILAPQFSTLLNAKTMLLINDNNRQLMHVNFFLDQRVGANNKLRIASGDCAFRVDLSARRVDTPA